MSGGSNSLLLAIHGQCVAQRVLSKKYHMRAYFITFNLLHKKGVKFSHKNVKF